MLTEILTKYADARQSESRVDIPPGLEMTMFATLGEESMIIDRVRAVDLQPEYTVITTARGERFVVLYEDLRAVRMGATGGGAGYEA